jgi:hypothetical protein
MFAVLLSGWIGGRVFLWEEPGSAPVASPARAATAEVPLGEAAYPLFMFRGASAPMSVASPASPAAAAAAPARLSRYIARSGPGTALRGTRHSVEPPFDLMRPGLESPRAHSAHSDPAGSAAPVRPGLPTAPAQPRPARFSIDAWGFYRQGSDSAPISQGRVPIYGASQFGAIAQFRAAPQSALDPRLYLRAYQALVENGESELSLGGSLRPLRALPVRAYVELRYLQTPFATDWRPAAYLVTEVQPKALPGRLQLEVYGQAGWVGGDFATAFADGQASLVREVTRFNAPGGVPLRLSAGAGAWGGAQKGAERVDVGPTVRLDWTMGRIPARLSLDWREQVAGDAAPESGLAATLSTSF